MSMKTINHSPESAYEFDFIKYKNGTKHKTLTVGFLPYESLRACDQHVDESDDSTIKHTPAFPAIHRQICEFIEGQIVVAHHATSHIDALQKTCDFYKLQYPMIEYCCTYTLTKKLHRPSLGTVNASECGNLIMYLLQTYGGNSLNLLLRKAKLTIGILFPNHHRPIRSISVNPLINSPEVDHPFYGQTIVFTGSLQSMIRSHAAKVVNEAGGSCAGAVTSRTNYVIIGDGLQNRSTKTSKQLHAEQLIAKGQAIEIMSEAAFLQIINQFKKGNND